MESRKRGIFWHFTRFFFFFWLGFILLFYLIATKITCDIQMTFYEFCKTLCNLVKTTSSDLANTLAWLRCMAHDTVQLFDSCETSQDWLHWATSASTSEPDTHKQISDHSQITIWQCSGAFKGHLFLSSWGRESKITTFTDFSQVKIFFSPHCVPSFQPNVIHKPLEEFYTYAYTRLPLRITQLFLMSLYVIAVHTVQSKKMAWLCFTDSPNLFYHGFYCYYYH